MKCPHCSVHFHEKFIETFLEGNWGIAHQFCPSCQNLIAIIVRGDWYEGELVEGRFSKLVVPPERASRPPAPPEVPTPIAQDYLEACLVLEDSPKASAALSRRCLQSILREKAGVKASNLANEIQQVLNSRQLPTWLSDNLDAIRNIGNFAAHPIKSVCTGEILDVEPGEAEWNLDVIEALFDFYFVQPELIKKKREALDKKLADAGKPPMQK